VIVDVSDYYKQVVPDANDVIVTAEMFSHHCSVNSEKAAVTGNMVHLPNNGMAEFSGLGVSCYPGGMFALHKKTFAFSVPMYVQKAAIDCLFLTG
jgi:hypothetical protein